MDTAGGDVAAEGGAGAGTFLAGLRLRRFSSKAWVRSLRGAEESSGGGAGGTAAVFQVLRVLGGIANKFEIVGAVSTNDLEAS